MEKQIKKNFIIDTLFFVIVALIVFLTFFVAFKYLFPFVIGAIIAFSVQKPAVYLSRKMGINSGIIAAVLSVVLYLLAGAILGFLGYKLVAFLIQISEFLPQYFEKIIDFLSRFKEENGGIFSYFSENFNISFEALIENSLQKIVANLGSGLSNFMKTAVKRAPSVLIAGVVTLVATCYISKDFLHLKKFLKLLLGEGITAKVKRVKDIMLGSVLRLLRGYLILSLITFCVLWLGLIILKVKNALSLAIIIALADMLPVIGTGTIMVPWAAVAAFSGNYFFAVALGVLFIIIVIMRNFLEPKIIGKQIGINALFTLAAMFLGLKLFGVLGLILFPVAFIVIVRYYKDEMKEEMTL